ncbi:MAG TPA: hypothetical protein VIK75_00335 [Calditerricola sp.]
MLRSDKLRQITTELRGYEQLARLRGDHDEADAWGAVRRIAESLAEFVAINEQRSRGDGEGSSGSAA